MALIACAVIFICICITAALGVAIWKLYPLIADRLPWSAATQATDLPLDPPVIQETRTLTAGEGGFSDTNGASLVFPPGTLPEAEALTVETASLSPGMQAELEKSASVDTPIYSVTAANMDGAGRAVLALPASSPDSRLAVLLDDQYLAVLPILPENGALTVHPFLGAPSAAGGYPTLALSALPNRYFVITPKPESSQSPVGSGRLASLLQVDPDIVSCIPRIWHGNRCWTNAAGSVVVLFTASEMPAAVSGTDPLQPPEVIDGVIKTVVKVMQAYQQAGLASAAISSSNPVYVVISAKEKEPNYSQKTGNIYLGWGVINELAAGNDLCTIAHELFHWVEDEEYAMNGAALVNDRAWWLEMSAENGSFLVEPACTAKVLSTYGVAEVGSQLAWQAAPFHWDWGEGARYIQSLQMYISLCEGGSRCAMSPSQFTQLINDGAYPSESAREAYYRNADDMGRYLLGYAPLLSRGDAFIPAALKSGQGYGDYIWLKNSPRPAVDISLNEGRITSTGAMEATASTTIAHGGVYPLWISNGKGSPTGGGNGFTALPAMLTVTPGAPFWYSLDNAAPKFHDGASELVLGSISDKLGVGLVRIIATAPEADAAFQAVVKPVDLSGDWSNNFTNTTLTAVNCPSSDNSDPEAFDFMTLFSAYGAYEPDPAVQDGSHYIWSGAIPAEGAAAQSEISVTPENIIVTYLIDIPRPATESGWLPWLPGSRAALSLPDPDLTALLNLLAGVLAGAGLLLVSFRRRPAFRLVRAAPLLLVVAAAGLWLSGCIGFAFWGTFQGTYTYTRLEVPNAEALPAEAAAIPGLKWMLDGQGQIDYNLHLLVVTEDADGNKVEEDQICSAQFTTEMKGIVGPPDMVPEPEE